MCVCVFLYIYIYLNLKLCFCWKNLREKWDFYLLGFVLGKKKVEGRKRSEAMRGDSSCWESRAEFGNFTYWNHDTVPSKEDPILRCFHWFSIANAVSVFMSFCSLQLVVSLNFGFFPSFLCNFVYSQ